jgi:hypothetical protein
MIGKKRIGPALADNTLANETLATETPYQGGEKQHASEHASDIDKRERLYPD